MNIANDPPPPLLPLPHTATVPRLGSLLRTRRALLGYLFVAPLVLWLGFTILYPLASAVSLSVQDVKVIGTGGKFMGLDNYTAVLSSGRFWNSLGRSVLWVVANNIVQTLLAFLTALILRQAFRGSTFVRTWVILSWVVPTVVVVIVWKWMLGTSGGIINYFLEAVGLIDKPIGFFGNASSAFASVTLINSWRWFPFAAVIILAGLLRIPAELYEAAAVDGANRFQKFRYITLPGLSGVMFVLGLIGTLLSFNVFDVIWLLTGGGPSSATQTLPVLIYETAFKQYRLSQAAAMAVITGAILLGFALVFFRLMSPKEEA